MTKPRRIDTPEVRKAILLYLQENGGWVEIKWIEELSLVRYSLPVVSRLLKMGLVETVKNDGRLSARITMSGRQALSRGEFTHKDRTVNLPLARDVYDGAKELAEELGIDGVTGVLRVVLGRREAFGRWYSNVYADELVEKKK